MQVINVNVYQRTATGGSTGAVTTIYAMSLAAIAEDAGVYLDTVDWAIAYPNIYQVYATIRIHHPVIMWGGYNEILQDYYRIAIQSIMDCGMAAYNDQYMPVWTLDMETSTV